MKKLQKKLTVAVDNNLPCLLVGKHGTGKSYSITQLAKEKEAKLHRVILTQETTPEDLVCQYELEDGETKMIKHDLLNAAEKGEWICFEELNMASPAVLTLLNGLLETDPESRFIKFQDIEIKPHKNFRLFATSNPTEYSGTNKMNDALLSRFLVELVQPDYKAFLSIIHTQYGETREKDAVKFLSAITKVASNYDIYISPRELLVYAQLRSNKASRKMATDLILGRHFDLDEDIIADIYALFQVESTREDIRVMNEVELKKLIDKGNLQNQERIHTLEKDLTKAKEFETKYEKIREMLSK